MDETEKKWIYRNVKFRLGDDETFDLTSPRNYGPNDRVNDDKKAIFSCGYDNIMEKNI